MGKNTEDKEIASVLGKARERLNRELLEIENRDDLTNDEKVSRIVNIFSITCAGIAIQPIPFADIFILTPIQAFMGSRIAAIRGVPVSEAKATEVVKELAGVVGLGMVAQQVAIGLYKTGLPFLGGFMTIPLVYGLTYGIGRVLDYYFTKKARGQRVSPEEIKDVWRRAKAEGQKEGKAVKAQVQDEGVALREP